MVNSLDYFMQITGQKHNPLLNAWWLYLEIRTLAKVGQQWRRNFSITSIVNYITISNIFNFEIIFLKEKHNVHTKVKCDNTTSIAYVNDMGG